MALIFVVILIALGFEYINGFHDTANSIATVVATKVLTPRQAVVMAACTNLIGAMCGTAVATTIASGLIDPQVASQKSLMLAPVGGRRLELGHLARRAAQQFQPCVDRRVGRGGGRGGRQLERGHLVAARRTALVPLAKACSGK